MMMMMIIIIIIRDDDDDDEYEDDDDNNKRASVFLSWTVHYCSAQTPTDDRTYIHTCLFVKTKKRNKMPYCTARRRYKEARYNSLSNFNSHIDITYFNVLSVYNEQLILIWCYKIRMYFCK